MRERVRQPNVSGLMEGRGALLAQAGLGLASHSLLACTSNKADERANKQRETERNNLQG